MAEFPDLGRHCEMLSCSRLDFTPFACANCRKSFCTEHRFAHACACEPTSEAVSSGPSSSIRKEFLCSFSGCLTYESVKFECSLCSRNFCMKHRQSEDHSCDDLKKSEPVKTKMILPDLPTQPKQPPKPSDVPKAQKEFTPEQQARADKVAVMKAKAKGTGGIPPGELMFVFVSLESGAREPTMVSKTWSIGKCVDIIAAQHKIENNNAKIDAKKIRLYQRDAGEPLPMGDNVLAHLKDMDDVKLLRD